jgi:DNA-binding response OmpR family regulator
MSQVVLLGLPEDLSHQLAQLLRDEAHQVRRLQSVRDVWKGGRPDTAFISGDLSDFRNVIATLREGEPQIAVIVVTRHPETSQWLDALEAGATDYCGAPFERVHVRWLMNSAAAPDGPAWPLHNFTEDHSLTRRSSR